MIFTEDGQKIIERDNVCCLIHSEPYLLEWALREEKVKKEQLDPSKVLLYHKFLKDRFSMQFLNFLCCSLKLNHSRRASIDDMISHVFLRSDSKECHTVNVSLQDLLLISKVESDPMIESVHLLPSRSRKKDSTSSSGTSCRCSAIVIANSSSVSSKIQKKRSWGWASTSVFLIWGWDRNCTRPWASWRRVWRIEGWRWVIDNIFLCTLSGAIFFITSCGIILHWMSRQRTITQYTTIRHHNKRHCPEDLTCQACCSCVQQFQNQNRILKEKLEKFIKDNDENQKIMAKLTKTISELEKRKEEFDKMDEFKLKVRSIIKKELEE